MVTEDEYNAVWISHSSISDFLKCPRAYFLKNVYKDPQTGHKIQLMTPPLALGQAVHEVLESLSRLPKDRRFDESLITKFEKAWQKISGEKGGFVGDEVENRYKNRGREMLERVAKNPGPFKNLAVKMKMDLPHFWLSKKDNIILCGKIDWLEYLPNKNGVHIIDFKTGRSNEESQSLQLPIYYLLAQNCQNYSVLKVSYWYLDHADEPENVSLPDLEKAREKILKIAKEIKLARQLERFECPDREEGCSACRPMEAVLRGEGRLVNVDEFNRDIYVLPQPSLDDGRESTIF
ncbi:hypothetical protein COT63_00145 [Candidatus Shapirobacteria bacterium CG09_land_8_20_14_0_10_38_17]|uniref:PD-(D/E)XK endonuclease-like domain-containing protein n=1 Tax=Candidatus Shapirobacteria bacterium CG09_land_8_20_14_0_10_38_17 TaxID=1974884 RepID=A0A2H0WS04_9BACT|nr:MAG: hypothetical protein COT63_00145 [Candidatus Shapirobacteria bacterium CG09_land_8_20_14_0_10_38_17]